MPTFYVLFYEEKHQKSPLKKKGWLGWDGSIITKQTNLFQPSLTSLLSQWWLNFPQWFLIMLYICWLIGGNINFIFCSFQRCNLMLIFGSFCSATKGTYKSFYHSGELFALNWCSKFGPASRWRSGGLTFLTNLLLVGINMCNTNYSRPSISKFTYLIQLLKKLVVNFIDGYRFQRQSL